MKATLSQCMAKAASPQCKVYGYGVNDGDEAMDFYADNVRVRDGEICFDFVHRYDYAYCFIFHSYHSFLQKT